MTYPQLSGDCFFDFEPYMNANNAIEEDINDAWREQEHNDHEQWLDTQEHVFMERIQEGK